MSYSIGSSLLSNNTTTKQLANSASSVGSKLSSAENSYISAVKSGDQGAIAKADVEYKKQQASYEALMQIIKNRYETMIRVIRNMSVS